MAEGVWGGQGLCMAGGMHGRWTGGHVWQGGMHGRGIVTGGVHGGACMAGACMAAGGVCAWQGVCMGQGHVWQGGMCGRGACMARGVHGGHAWQGGVHGRGVCMAGGVRDRRDSHWNAFLFLYVLTRY